MTTPQQAALKTRQHSEGHVLCAFTHVQHRWCQPHRIVKRLTYHPQTSPFDLLSQRQAFNYFMAWLPSPDDGFTVLNELDRVNVVGTQAQGMAIAEPASPRMGVPAWNVQELLHEVGPPTPLHDPLGSPLGTEAAGRLHDWRELRGGHITSGLVTGVYQTWLDLNDRVLLKELDTAFHLALSDHPRVDGSVTARDSVQQAAPDRGPLRPLPECAHRRRPQRRRRRVGHRGLRCPGTRFAFTEVSQNQALTL